ncbi:MAG: hypothetical protein AAGF12_21575 [Myxococcota bacterium]
MAVDDDESLEGEGGREQRGMPVDVARIARALFRGKLWLAAAIVIGGGIGFVSGKFLIKSSYVSDGVLKFEGVPNPFGDGEIAEADVTTLSEAMQSRPVLTRVKDRLGLAGDLTAVKARTVVSPDASAQTIRISAGAGSAEEAAEFANAMMEAFIAYQTEREVGRLQGELAAIDERIAAANSNLASAREAYDAFREEHSISDLTTEQRQMITRATDTRAAADVAATEITALEARIEQLRSRLETTPQTVSTGGSPERTELRRLQGELATARANLSEDHPRVRALRERINTLRLRINSGDTTQGTGTSGTSQRFESLQDALQGAEAELVALRRRQEGLEQTAEEAAARVAEFSEIEGEATALQAQVRVNETLSTELTNQRARLADALRGQTSGFRIFTPATVPDYPLPNKQKYIVAAGIPAALVFLVILFLLFREFRGLRIRTAREVGYWGKGPVLGTTTWPRDEDAVKDLIADLDDFVPVAKGRMLVVGVTEAETALAAEIVDQLNNDWFPESLIDLEAYVASGASPDQTGPQFADNSSALARRPSTDLGPVSDFPVPSHLDARAWDGPVEGQALRRASRLADRVMIVVTSGAMSAFDLAKVPDRLGRRGGLGYVLVGIEDELSNLPDRTGRVSEFWAATREHR